MSRKLDIKKGDTVYMKVEEMSNAARRKEPFSLNTFDDWVTEVQVTSVGRKYITVGKEEWSQIKFNIENDYREHYTCGGSDHKLYVSRQEILDEMEYNSIYSNMNTVFNMYGNAYGRCDLSLDQLRRMRDIVNE